MADAKHRLAFTLLSAVEIDIERGEWTWARARAAEALEMAELLARPSEIVLAYAALGRVAAGQEDRATLKQLRAELRNRTSNQVSRMAQDAALVIT